MTEDIETFRQIVREWDEALVANDAERIALFATPGWTFISRDGLFPGSEFLTSVASGAVSHDSMSSEVVTIYRFGEVAVVVTRVANTGTYNGERFENDEWVTDTFVRRDDRWLCELTHLTPARPSP